MTERQELAAILRESRGVDWAALRGAYGPSDASDHYRNIPGMLQTLATLDDIESPSWGDAYDDAFLAQVWHQYTLYPVTPVALDFLIRIASLRSGTEPAKQIGLGLQLIAESVAGLRSDPDPQKRRLGEATFTVFSKYSGDIRSWLGGPLGGCAEMIGKWLPEILN